MQKHTIGTINVRKLFNTEGDSPLYGGYIQPGYKYSLMDSDSFQNRRILKEQENCNIRRITFDKFELEPVDSPSKERCYLTREELSAALINKNTLNWLLR
jgi:hypothetical protein